MEKDHAQLKSLGFFGTIKESFNIVLSWKRIFTLITLTLILPLSFTNLAQIPLSNLLSNINTNNNQTDKTGSLPAPPQPPPTSNNTKHQIFFRLFDLAFYNFLYNFNLLSIAVVAYTIACIFAAKQTTFKKVISVVPRVWKRLRVTYRWIVAVLFVYILVGVGILTLFVFSVASRVVGFVIILFMVYLAGLLYILIVSQLASVVSVLEEKHGLEALKKGRNLIKGRMRRLAAGTFILYGILFVGVISFAKFVVSKWSHNLAIAIPVAILCFLLLSVVILFGLVVQTIVYFVCKSYHDETIDKSSLSVNLEENYGDHVELNRSQDVQLEQSRV